MRASRPLENVLAAGFMGVSGSLIATFAPDGPVLGAQVVAVSLPLGMLLVNRIQRSAERPDDLATDGGPR